MSQRPPRLGRAADAARAIASFMTVLSAGSCGAEGPGMAVWPPASELRIIGISPNSAVRGSGTVALEIHGSGFTQDLEVVFDGVIIPSQIADTHLIVAFIPSEVLGSPGPREVSVRAVGAAHASGSLTFTVLNPRPSVEMIEPSAVRVGVTSDFTVRGGDFVPGAQVWLGDAAYPTTYVSPTELRLAVHGSHFALVRSLPVRVVNPAPGGGSSTVGARLSVGAVPTLLGVTQRVVPAGSGPLTLTLLGTGFTPDATVEIDGSRRETTVLGPDRVSVELGAAETAAPGALELIVSTAEGRSSPTWLTVVSGSTALTDHIAIERPTREVVYDPARDLLYFTARSAAEVFALDPHTGDEVWTLSVQGEVGPLAFTDDGSFLYAAYMNGGGIVRIDPEAPGVALEIPLEGFSTPGAPYSGYVVRDVATVPGAPEQVVAEVHNTCCSPSAEGLVLFTGASRSEPVARAVGIAVESAVSIYTTRSGGVLKLAVNGTALEVAATIGSLDTRYGEVEYGGGYIFTEWGARWDARAGIMRAVGHAKGAIALDLENGRIHYFDPETSALHTLHPFSLEEIGRMEPPFAWQSRAIARWGPDGLAVAGGDPFTVIFRSPLIGG